MTRYVSGPLSELLHIIFPAICCHCGAVLVGDERDLCTSCMSLVPWARLAAVQDNDVELRLAGRIPCQAAASLLFFRHGNVAQTLLHQIKYADNLRLAKQFGGLLGEELLASGRFDGVDCLVPVPLHPLRKLKRGYNQSELLCRAIASVLNKPVVVNNLIRKRYTDSQTHKNRMDRMDNMSDVFAVRHPEQFENKHLLLVDDIITTGATTENCYAALHDIPSLRISVASLAVAFG